jgi:hypothetical protein
MSLSSIQAHDTIRLTSSQALFKGATVEENFTDSSLDNRNHFSSPELKAQVSYSDRLLSVFRLSVNFYIFHFFCRTTGPILTKLGTNHPWERLRGFKFIQMNGGALL